MVISENFEGYRTTKIDSLIIQGVVYKDIITLENLNQSQDLYEKAYYAPKIGLIKFEESRTGRVWEIIKYDVKQ